MIEIFKFISFISFIIGILIGILIGLILSVISGKERKK